MDEGPLLIAEDYSAFIAKVNAGLRHVRNAKQCEALRSEVALFAATHR